MKFRFSLFLGTLFIVVPVYTQIAVSVPSATSVANASVAVQNDWNAFQNTSALAHIETFEASAQYENRFMIKELSTKSLQAAINAKYVNVGLAFSYFGYSLYNDMILGIGSARNFGDKFSMGVQFNYYMAYFSGEGINRYRGTIFPQVGLSSRIFPNLTIGFNAFNPFLTNIKTEYSEKKIPSVFSLGSNYNFSQQLIWLAQIDKEVNSNFRFATGFEYTMLEKLTVKLGAYATDFLVPCLGADIHLNRFNIYLNTEFHPQLGLNSRLCLKYRY